MFVTAGDELDIKAIGPFVPGDGVGDGGAVGMADMQVGAGIVNGRRNIKSRFRHSHSPLTKNNSLTIYDITKKPEMHGKRGGIARLVQYPPFFTTTPASSAGPGSLP